MEFIGQERAQRIYRSSTGEYVIVELRTQGYFAAVERSVFESHDPADRRRIEQAWTSMRTQIAAFFAEHEEYDISDGLLDQRVDAGDLRVQAPDGVVVPAVMLIVEQPYWPPAPEEGS